MNKYVTLILQKPSRTDITMKQLISALQSLGVTIRNIRGGHVVFIHPDYPDIGKLVVPIPHGNKKNVHRCYIEDAQEFIEKIFDEQQGGLLWNN